MYTNCAGMTGTQITIPPPVDLAIAKSTDAGARAKFREEWERDLREAWERNSDNQLRGARFLWLARWLDAHRHEDIGTMLEKMETLGEPDELLVKRLGGEGERGDREIANPLTHEPGFGLVKKILDELQEKDEAHWSLGIRMLADRLAEVAGEEEER